MDIHRLYEIIGRSRFLQLHTRFVRFNYIILFMICQGTKKDGSSDPSSDVSRTHSTLLKNVMLLHP